MTNRPGLPPAGKAYVAVISGLGVVALAHAIITLLNAPPAPSWLVLAALTVFSSTFTVRIPALPATVSVSETFVFLLFLMYGASSATLTVAVDGLFISVLYKRSRHNPYRILFNITEPALSVWVAAFIFKSLHSSIATNQVQQIQALIIPLGSAALAYFLLNSLLTATAVGFELSKSPFRIWRDHFSWVFVNYLGGASLALLLFSTTPQISFGTIGIVVPLLIITYLAFKSAMARVEDTTQHLSELNDLYLSTIETLAMAVDAKDQITHGHIRRVQRHAVLLARATGITDETVIKAIEAAALLHDMGKLGVPEYILNKPGQLTPAEFEKMKAHARIGADILSGVKFPYPVVPMVRHHHEHWDGSGYPDSLRGSEIPVGARILAVVDCFDALTSDRPYRPRLTEQAALAVLRERRGTIYDPAIVDAFFDVWRQDKQAIKSALVTDKATDSALSETSTRSFETISSSSVEIVALHNLVRDAIADPTLDRCAELLSHELGRFVPASMVAFFAYEAAADDLVPIHVVGKAAGHLSGRRLQLGKGITGWVGANRTTIVNSDPSLDFGESIRSLEPPLRSTLSVPVGTGRLLGVISFYASLPNAFTTEHVRIVEVFVRQIASLLGSAGREPRVNVDSSSHGLVARSDDKFSPIQ